MACVFFFLSFSLFFQFLFYIRHLSGAHHFLCDCVFSHNHVKLFQHGQTFWGSSLPNRWTTNFIMFTNKGKTNDIANWRCGTLIANSIKNKMLIKWLKSVMWVAMQPSLLFPALFNSWEASYHVPLFILFLTLITCSERTTLCQYRSISGTFCIIGSQSHDSTWFTTPNEGRAIASY